MSQVQTWSLVIEDDSKYWVVRGPGIKHLATTYIPPMGTTETPDQSSEPCSACDGTGYQLNQVTGINEVCPVCHGTEKKLPVTYPVVTVY